MRAPHLVESTLYTIGTVLWAVVAFVGLCFWHMIASLRDWEEGDQ